MLISNKYQENPFELQSNCMRGSIYDVPLLQPPTYLELHLSFLEPLFAAFALKLILNAVSTGANILRGRVYHNMMVNLKVANDKVLLLSTLM